MTRNKRISLERLVSACVEMSNGQVLQSGCIEIVAAVIIFASL